VAIALKRRVRNLLAKLLADALIFLGMLQPAGTVSTGALQALPDCLYHFLIFIQMYSHKKPLFIFIIPQEPPNRNRALCTKTAGQGPEPTRYGSAPSSGAETHSVTIPPTNILHKGRQAGPGANTLRFCSIIRG